MLKNEGGFTFLEGIVSLSLILLVTSSFFPLMSNMLARLKDGKIEMTAYRLMYEHVEKHTAIGVIGDARISLHDIEFDLNMEETEKGNWKVCVHYEEKRLCVE
ncbi:type II secretion system protein [Bacillus norwichensis]|uniref:Type II secretion system protein n=1 Tax=Bacillus norwichensis TaxID=2762217 RepID=A0ABR8VFQ8_9BACI|nr:type II secretion system protein [Bacillus norwichensis]MBD8003558.1 type II secretion system protein [Bacillus norwichensis]